ncbi:hypothetical protein LCGC14_2220250 [marine sediment metagenome]|uniref:ArnR1-like winged helix-turn-helix domain-containing protein n=1 Tax=marine sediment metagenome TaxID=412755 RepID=A0A0F9DB63_9ZZZZ
MTLKKRIVRIGDKGMNIFQSNLEKTVKAINYLVKKKVRITVEKIRQFHDIKSSNRSKVNFIWRGLAYLNNQNVLKCISKNSPKIYELTPQGKEYIENFDLKIE